MEAVITNSDFNENLKNLWDQYVQIQEQLLKKKGEPISINPDTLSIEGNKMIVEIDEADNYERAKRVLKERLMVGEEDISDNKILVGKDVWKQSDIASIQKELSACYVEVDRTPSINATIYYGDIMPDFLSLEEIRQKDKELKTNKMLVGGIEDNVVFVSKIDVNVEAFCKYLFGDHYSYSENENGKRVHTVKYLNRYVSEEDLCKGENKIGLRIKDYRIRFRINNKDARKKMRYEYDYKKSAIKYMEDYNKKEKEENEFEFLRNFEAQEKFSADVLNEVQENINAFLSEARRYCTLNEIKFEVEFEYYISYDKTRRYIFNKVSNYTRTQDGMRFNYKKGEIGIDFNWRTNDIETKIKNFEKAILFVTVKRHSEDHKFKYKRTASVIGFDKIKNKLEEHFEYVSVTEAPAQNCIYIRLSCYDIDSYDRQYAHLKNFLLNMDLPYEIKMDSLVSNKVCIGIRRNEESKADDIEERLKDLRKFEFGVDLDGKNVIFGKLLRVRYPELVFDLDIDQENKAEVNEYLGQGAVRFVIPILAGEIEKIHRLRDTFKKLDDGRDLSNENLQNFIFDSTYATPIGEDINYILAKDGVAYSDLNNHLINSRINESQKEAILKCIYAKDMAVIQGPPGTGKSTAIAELIWQLVRHGLKTGNTKERILLTSETNLAVDNAISRILNSKTNLVKPIRLGEKEKLEAEGLQFSFELMKQWVENGNDVLNTEIEDEDTGEVHKTDLVFNNWLTNISSRAFFGLEDATNDVMCRWKNTLANPDKSIRDAVFKHYVESCNVIGATCSSIGDKKSEGRGYTQFFRNYREIFKRDSKKIKFTTVIQDESSKATPAELALPFVYGEKAIVIGDHRQLPPILDREEMEDVLEYAIITTEDSQEKEKILQLRKFLRSEFNKIEESHFQRLYENIDESLKQIFNLQYRMHPDINDVIKQFYVQDGGLNCGLIFPKDLGVNDSNFSNSASRYHGITIAPIITPSTHILFINTNSPEMLDGTSRVNYGEVEVVGKLLDKMEQSDSFQKYLSRFAKEEDKQIGIISFYGKQIRLIRNLARQHKEIPSRVSTVDRFQGMERNIIIVSMVRSNVIQSHKDEKPNYSKYQEDGYPAQKSLGFAQSPNRLNVALSRAKRLLIIVGNEKHFSTHPIYKELFKTIRNNPNNVIINQDKL